MVTTEPEWDEESRGRVMALADFERNVCPCGCGQQMSESHKPNPYDVQTFTCYAGRAIAVQTRKDQEDAERTKRPEGWNDGLHYYARPVDPSNEPKETRWPSVPSLSG